MQEWHIWCRVKEQSIYLDVYEMDLIITGIHIDLSTISQILKDWAL